MLQRRKKIVVIGAGSNSFGLNSLAGIMRTKNINGMELVLVDVDKKGLRQIEKLAHLLNEKWNANMKVIATSNRKVALVGADYIIISIAIDRNECWKSDFEIALKYGIKHYAENGGPGGFIHSARNISMLLPILEDIETLCPDAFIINFTNPMQRICELIKEKTSLKFIGMCHQIYFGYYILATLYHKELDIKLKEDTGYVWNDDFMKYHLDLSTIGKRYFDIKAAGINHFTCMMDIRKKENGKSIMKEVKKRFSSLPPEFEPLTQEMFRIFNLILVQGDSHIVEYVPYASDLYTNTFEKYAIPMFDFEWSTQKRVETKKNIEQLINGDKDIDYLKSTRSEGAEYIIEAKEKNLNCYESVLVHPNIPNNGCISNLPEGAIVEVPGIISGNGVNGLAMGDLPRPMAEICRRQIILNEMTVKSVIEGDIKLVYQIFALDPMINNLETARKLADEYIKINTKYLDTFK